MKACGFAARFKIFFLFRYTLPGRGTPERCGGTLCTNQGDLCLGVVALGSFVYDQGGVLVVDGPRAELALSKGVSIALSCVSSISLPSERCASFSRTLGACSRLVFFIIWAFTGRLYLLDSRSDICPFLICHNPLFCVALRGPGWETLMLRIFNTMRIASTLCALPCGRSLIMI